VVTVSEPKGDFEGMVGTRVPKTTIYMLLERYDRIKIALGSFHPTKSEDRQEAFKKTLRTR